MQYDYNICEFTVLCVDLHSSLLLYLNIYIYCLEMFRTSNRVHGCFFVEDKLRRYRMLLSLSFIFLFLFDSTTC